MRIVHCSYTPCAGAIEALSSAIRDHTVHDSRWIGNGGNVNNLTFDHDVLWADTASHVLLARADVVILHNYLNDLTEPIHDYFLGDGTKKCIGFFHSHPEGIRDGARLVEQDFPHFCVAQYQALFFQKAIPIRNVVRFDRSDWPKRRERNDGKVRIGYSPTFRRSQEGLKPGSSEWYHCKGYDVTMPVLQEMEKRKDVELCIIEGCAYDYAMQLKADCDILIDEIVTGSYHRSTLEGLALGIPTIVNVSADVWGVLASATGLDADAEFPFVQASPDNLKDVLGWLIGMKKKERKAIGDRGRAWMEKHWHPRDIAREFCDLAEAMSPYCMVPEKT